VSNTDTGVTPSQGFDASTTDSFANPSAPRPRHDSQLLTLPAPLALNRPLPAGGSSSSVARSNEDVYSDNASSQQRLVSSPTSTATEHQVEEYHGASSPGRGNHDHHNARATGGHGAIRQAIAPISFPVDTPNPFQTGPGDYYGVEHDVTHSASPSPSGGPPRSRGVSLSDKGPVPLAPEGVRRVSRPTSRRPTSQTAQQNRYSRPPSVYATLPPGAAAPNPNSGHYGRPEN
jgi:chitin synthase